MPIMTDRMYVFEPSAHDVLCGRGGATNSHSGNKNFRRLVSDAQREYLGARKKEKAGISARIVKAIQEEGGRFLRKNDRTGTWEEVNDKKAREKTSQALRENLDVRNKSLRPAMKRARRGSESSDEWRPIKRKKSVTWEDHTARLKALYHPGNTTVVAEEPDLEEESVQIPVMDSPPPTTADCDDVASV